MRRDLQAMLALADRLDAAGERGVFATLVSTRGSSYRPLGSMMLAGPPGTPRAGGVSGGCLEEYIARRGRELLADRPAALLGFDTTSDGEVSSARPTLGCGGHVDVLIERFTPAHRAMLQRMHAAATVGPALRVETLVELVTLGSEPDRLDVAVTRTWIVDGHASGLNASDGLCSNRPIGGTHALKQTITPQPRLIVCGAGDDAQPLVTLAAMADFSVTVVDRRARLAARGRFPDADRVETVDADWDAIRDVVRSDDRVVLLTHDLTDDIAICVALSRGPPLRSLGVLGPVHRLGWLQEALRGANVDGTFIDGIRGPIGLDLGGRSPEQIALSIVAELTADRFDRDGQPLSATASQSPSTIASRR